MSVYTQRDSATRNAHDRVLMLAERTGPEAPVEVRVALATLAAALGDGSVADIAAGRLGWDSEDGPMLDRITWAP